MQTRRDHGARAMAMDQAGELDQVMPLGAMDEVLAATVAQRQLQQLQQAIRQPLPAGMSVTHASPPPRHPASVSPGAFTKASAFGTPNTPLVSRHVCVSSLVPLRSFRMLRLTNDPSHTTGRLESRPTQRRRHRNSLVPADACASQNAYEGALRGSREK